MREEGVHHLFGNIRRAVSRARRHAGRGRYSSTIAQALLVTCRSSVPDDFPRRRQHNKKMLPRAKNDRREGLRSRDTLVILRPTTERRDGCPYVGTRDNGKPGENRRRKALEATASAGPSASHASPATERTPH